MSHIPPPHPLGEETVEGTSGIFSTGAIGAAARPNAGVSQMKANAAVRIVRTGGMQISLTGLSGKTSSAVRRIKITAWDSGEGKSGKYVIMRYEEVVDFGCGSGDWAVRRVVVEPKRR
jgi:hypothetical protein